jgi:hypothetical protein
MIIDPKDNEPQAGTDAPRWAITGVLTLDKVLAWCRQCGRHIEIMPPQSLQFASSPEDKWSHELHDGALVPLPGYGDPAMCIDCRMKAADPDRQESLLVEYRSLLHEAAKAGMEHVTIWPIYSGTDSGFQWRWLMTQVVSAPENLSDWPGLDVFWFTTSDGTRHTFLNYEARLWCSDIDGALRWRSHPASPGQTLEVINWQHLSRQDRYRLMDGVDLYTALRPRGGRNPECIENMLLVLRKFRGPEPPKRYELARLIYGEWHPKAAADSLRQCLNREKRRTGRTYEDFLREAGWDIPRR